MKASNVVVSIVAAGVLATGGCSRLEPLKEKIPFLGGEKEQNVIADVEKDEPREADEAANEKTGAEDAAPGDAAEAETAEKPAAGEEAPAKTDEKTVAKTAQEPPIAAKPAGNATVKTDIPASVKSKTKVDKIMVVAHPEDMKKYGPQAKKLTPGIKECHRSALVDAPKTQGKIKLVVTVAPDGTVKGVSIEKNQTGSDDLAACAAKVFEDHAWPKRKDGEDRVLSIPILFKIP